MRHRALIVGAGRMGAGYGNWGPWPYVYIHADAYLALKMRAELCGFVEPSQERTTAAYKKYGDSVGAGGWFRDLGPALDKLRPDIVSICTPPDPASRLDIITACTRAGVKGIWCEKPYALTQMFDIPIQVNYIRRFDERHRRVKNDCHFTGTELWVWAKRDLSTVCHFTDLARFWEVDKRNIHYFHMDGPNSYLYKLGCAIEFFPLGGIQDGGFMESALGNLMDAMEGKDGLISPPENAIESEKWAEEILNDNCP